MITYTSPLGTDIIPQACVVDNRGDIPSACLVIYTYVTSIVQQSCPSSVEAVVHDNSLSYKFDSRRRPLEKGKGFLLVESSELYGLATYSAYEPKKTAMENCRSFLWLVSNWLVGNLATFPSSCLTHKKVVLTF